MRKLQKLTIRESLTPRKLKRIQYTHIVGIQKGDNIGHSAISRAMAVLTDPSTWTYNLLRKFCKHHQLTHLEKKAVLLEHSYV